MKIRSLFFAIVLLATASAVNADPLTFSNVRALQDNGNTSVNLFGNTPTLTGTQLSFLVDVSGSLVPGATDTLRITYHDSLGGTVTQDFGIPLFGQFPPPVTVFVSINLPTFSYVAIPATLNIDLLNSSPDFQIPSTQTGVNSYTYSFNVVQPVPEPTSLSLLLGAGPSVLVGVRRARKNKKAAR